MTSAIWSSSYTVFTEDFSSASVMNNTESGSNLFDIIFWVNHLGEVLIALLIILGNSLVLVAIAKEKNLQTTTNYFVASLAAADLLVGLLGIPCAVLGFNGIPEDFYGCLLMNTMIVTLTQISIFALLLIALERFSAIKLPFQYQEKCTGKLAMLFIICSWVAGVLVGFLPALAWDKSGQYQDKCEFTAVIDMEFMVYFSFLCCMLIPFIIMGCIYFYIFHVIRQTVRQIASLQIPASTSDGTDGPDQAKLSIKKEAKAAKWFAVVLLFFGLCWIPLHIMNSITLMGGVINLPALTSAILLSHLNSALNPILYTFANSKFKLAFKKLLGCGTSEQDVATGLSSAPRNSAERYR